MLVLIPVFWMLFALGPSGAINGKSGGIYFRKASPPKSVPMTGKPIKIPPKKV
jgi:hypothetical protein